MQTEETFSSIAPVLNADATHSLMSSLALADDVRFLLSQDYFIPPSVTHFTSVFSYSGCRLLQVEFILYIVLVCTITSWSILIGN